MLSYGDKLLDAKSSDSFWSRYYTIADPFDGLVWVKSSTQKTEQFPRLGAAPMPSQWSGDRDAKVVNEYSYSATNLPYDSTIKIDKELVEYQQWDAIGGLVANQGEKAMAHKTKQLSTILAAGTSTVCEDGQFYFDTDHKDPGAEYTTNQDNDLTTSIVAAASPTDIEAITALRLTFNALWSFKDDRGDPTVPADTAASNFIVMVPPGYRSVMLQIQNNNQITGPIGNELQGQFQMRVNPFLTANQFFLLYAGNEHKALILQESKPVTRSVSIDHASGNYFHSAEWWGVAKYGQWRNAVSYVFTTT